MPRLPAVSETLPLISGHGCMTAAPYRAAWQISAQRERLHVAALANAIYAVVFLCGADTETALLY